MNRTYSVALLVWAVAGLASADIIELSDGRKFNGSLTRTGDVMTIKTDDGKTITAKPDQIAKVTLTSTVTPEEAAAAEWSRIGQQAKTADSLQTVIDSYQKFIEKYPAAKQIAEARTTLEAYQKLAQTDAVKFRGRWMAPAQVEVQIKQWADSAHAAADLYRAGRMQDALEAAKTAITADAKNPDALAIAGLAAYRSGGIPAARTYFTSLVAADPGSVLAENNLAVISSVQKNPAEGLLHYAKAMQIAPDNRVVLDNIAEALNTFVAGGGDKNVTAYRALVKQYEPAEARMEETMGKQGLVRWGSTWVTKDKQAKLAKFQEDVRQQMAQLDTQYASAKKSLAALEGQIRQTADDADSYARAVQFNDAQIQIGTQRSLDVTYYYSQRDAAAQNYDRSMRFKAQLATQHDQMAEAARDFFAQADHIKAAMASGSLTGQFTGTQRIIDLGDVANPPAPASVPDPVALPELKAPPTIINQPPTPATPPIMVPVPVPVPVVVPGR